MKSKMSIWTLLTIGKILKGFMMLHAILNQLLEKYITYIQKKVETF